MNATAKFLHGLAIALAMFAVTAGPAAAQVSKSDVIAAEALFEQGRTLMQQKRYDPACEKFEASHKLDPSVGALLNLGDCRQKLGQTASAWVRYRQAVALALQLQDDKRAQFARQRADALEGKLSYLVIDVSDQAHLPDLIVTRNGEPVAAALWNQRAPVDPGSYLVRAEAPGHLPYEARVELAPGGGEDRVTIPVLRPGTAAPGQTIEATGAEAYDRVPLQNDSAPALPLGRQVALASGAVSVTSLIVGAALGVQARSRWNRAKETCFDGMFDQCTPEGVELSRQANRKGKQATVAFSVGVAAAAAAAIFWYVTPPARAADAGETGDAGDAEPDTARIEPLMHPDMLGAQVHVRF